MLELFSVLNNNNNIDDDYDNDAVEKKRVTVSVK